MSVKFGKTIELIVTVSSVIFCTLILLIRLPGMELLGIRPNWLLIWVVVWSIKRTVFQGAVAGLALGLIQDGMTGFQPTHVLSLVLVGAIAARLQKQKYIQEDFISIALIVFFMAIIAETVMAIQFGFMGDRQIAQIWIQHQRIALSSAILNSLWAPVIYFPLNHFWKLTGSIEP